MPTLTHPLSDFKPLFAELLLPTLAVDHRFSLLWSNDEAARRFPFLQLEDGVATLLAPNKPDALREALCKGSPLAVSCGTLPATGGVVHLTPILTGKRLEGALLFWSADWPRDQKLSFWGAVEPAHRLLSGLRAHLAVCFSVTGLLQRSLANGENAYLADMMEQSCYRLLREIGNMDAFSSYLTGGYDHLKYGDLRLFLRGLGEAIQLLLDEIGLSLSLNLPASPVWARFDAGALSLAVVNLIDNAYLFRSTSVGLSLTMLSDTAVITVSDNGPGIPDHYLSHIFEPFFTGPQEDSRKFGAGIGLTLVKMTAAAHHGTAAAQSDAEGTRVSLSIPAKSESSPPDPQKSAQEYLHNRFASVYVGLSSILPPMPDVSY